MLVVGGTGKKGDGLGSNFFCFVFFCLFLHTTYGKEEGAGDTHGSALLVSSPEGLDPLGGFVRLDGQGGRRGGFPLAVPRGGLVVLWVEDLA